MTNILERIPNQVEQEKKLITDLLMAKLMQKR